MVSVSMTHLIGTVSLMLIFFSVGSYYSISINTLKNEAITVQLSKIANYIGSDIVDLVTLSHVSDLDQLLVKNLTLPAGITSYGYNMTIETIRQTMYVRVYLISDSLVYGEYALPWSTESSIKIYNGSDTKVESYIQTERHNLTPRLFLDNEDTGLVIWCAKIKDQITIGLG